MRTLEKEVEAYLRKRVKEKGGLCFKFTSPGATGVPDRIVILNGVHFVELKRPEGGKLSPAQIVMHKMIRQAGEEVHVIKNRKEVDHFVECICASRVSKSGDRVGVKS